MKKILFIHNTFPDDGASGKVVFLRHFKNLGPECEVHIAVPDNLRKQKPLTYPENFFVHYIPLRRALWPPFRESSPVLISLRIFFLKHEVNNLIDTLRPDTVISVLNSYLAIAAAFSAKARSIPFILFVHDRWELFSDSMEIRKIRTRLSFKAMQIASKIFPVSESLITTEKNLTKKKIKLLYPIPISIDRKAQWRGSLSQTLKIVHVGTINRYAVSIFEFIAKNLEPEGLLELVYVEMDFLEEPLKRNKNIKIVQFFPTSRDAIYYVREHASAVLVNYGLTEGENPFSTDSFPSRFVEFSQAGVPIICIAHESSTFYNFLKRGHWTLLFDNNNIDELPGYLQKLKEERFWISCANETKSIAEKFFNPLAIQNIFENEINETLLQPKT